MVENYVNVIVQNLVKEWPGETTIVNGRPRNPKCQGVIILIGKIDLYS